MHGEVYIQGPLRQGEGSVEGRSLTAHIGQPAGVHCDQSQVIWDNLPCQNLLKQQVLSILGRHVLLKMLGEKCSR